MGVEASHVLGGRPGHGDEALERQEVDDLGVGEPVKGLSLFQDSDRTLCSVLTVKISWQFAFLWYKKSQGLVRSRNIGYALQA